MKVGYATIAKKVDVKRLKRDLWSELEQTFASKRQESDGIEDDEAEEKDEEKS